MDKSEIVFQYFPELTAEQSDRIRQLGPLYTTWNARINLISRKDIDALYERHVLHSLSIAQFIQFKAGTKILDVGTGGGFPGIPLAIRFPEVEFVLLDSIRKKIRVVENICETLNIRNVRVQCDRVENVEEKFDFITARAVTKITSFFGWTKSKILSSFTNEIPNGILYLKGGDLTDELQGFQRRYELIELKRYFREPFFETKKLVYIPFVK